jgi:two-component system nitrogen regulation sensor histidine kinase NtrY
MEDHGGRLELEEAPGGFGAEVSLILPALAAEPAASMDHIKELPAR